MNQFDDKTKIICGQIGQFYLQKHNGDHEAANQQIKNLHITKIETVYIDGFDYLLIYTARPGILIGPKGQDIEKLAEFLGKKIKLYEDNHINDLMFSYPCEDTDIYFDENPDIDYFVDDEDYI